MARVKKKVALTEPKRSPEFETVLTRFPKPLPRRGLTSRNALNGMPPAHHIIIERGTFFNKTGWRVYDSWRLLGWSVPPYRKEENSAIVFEKLTPPDFEGHYHDRLEPGIYWLHGSRAVKYSNV